MCEWQTFNRACEVAQSIAVLSILSRIAVMCEWQTLIVVKWHRAVLSKEIVSQC